MGDSVNILPSIDALSSEKRELTSVPPLGKMSSIEALRDKLLLGLKPITPLPLQKRIKKTPYGSKKKIKVTGSDPSKEGVSVEMSLERLRAQGYALLPTNISQKKGAPWNTLLKISRPVLIEQLYDLLSLMEIKNVESTALYEYAYTLAKENHPAASEWIGKLLVLIDRNPANVIENAKQPQDVFVRWVQEEYTNQISKTLAFLKNYKEQHRKTGLQNADVAYYNQLTVELTHYLLTETGHLNTGLIFPLMETFIDDPKSIHNHLSSFSFALRSLEKSPSLREQLAQIVKPSSVKAPANVVIRTTLDLRPNIEITDLETRKTALAALMSHLRQGSDGSCFATPLAIGLLNNRLSECLNDFAQLLHLSKLTRTVNNVSCDFPFILKIGDQNLLKNVTINRKGHLVLSDKSSVAFKEVPGIHAVLEALNLDRPKNIQTLFRSAPADKMEVEIPIKTLLQHLVKQAKRKPENIKKGLAMLYLDACFAFEAQQSNPMLQIWENAIAGMAEADEESMVRSAILASTTRVLREKIKTVLPQDLSLRKKLSQHLRKGLLERIHLQYDPQIAYSDKSADQRSTEGAFVLYDKDHFSKPSCWLRIDSPELYQTFINRLIESSKRGVKKEVSKEEWKTLHHCYVELEKYLSGSKFILDSISDYYPPNGEMLEPVKNYHSINFAPWITKSGNNLNKVMQVYLEDPTLLPTTQIEQKNAAELLYKLIDKARSLKRVTLANYQARPNHTIPIRIPDIHAFSLLPAHPSFISSWLDDSTDTTVWINSNVLLPGIKIASSEIPESSRKKLIELTHDNLIRSSKRGLFSEKIKKLPNELSIKEYRETLLKMILKLQPEYAASHKQIALQLDQYVFQSLTDKMQSELRSTAVHIADSNWGEGVHDIHFCIVINPGTAKLELWSCTDDNSKFYPLDQSTWFGNKSWEIFGQF